jgi:WD40 repeat protein
VSAQDQKVASLAFAANGVALAATIERGPIRVWEVWSGRVVKTLNIPRASDAIALSHDGRLLATAAPGGAVQVTDLISGDVAPLTLPVGATATALRFSPNDDLVAVATGERVTLHRLKDRAAIREFAVNGPTVGLGVIPTEKGLEVMAMSSRGLIVMCNVEGLNACTEIDVTQLATANGAPRTPRGDETIVQAQFFSNRNEPDLPLVAYVESSGRPVIAELTNFMFRNKVARPYSTGLAAGEGSPYGIAIAPDGMALVLATARGAYVVDRTTAFAQDVTLPTTAAVTSVAYAPAMFALALADGSVQLLAHPGMFEYAKGQASGELLLTHPASSAPDPLRQPTAAIVEALARARNSLIGDPEKSLTIALQLADDDIAAGRPVQAATEQMLHAGIIWSRVRYRSAEPQPVKTVRISSDGQWIGTLAIDGSIAIRTAEGIFVRRAKPMNGTVSAIEWAAGGGALIAGTSTGDLIRYNPVSWDVERVSSRRHSGLSFIRSSHDGNRLAVSEDDGLHIVDAATLADISTVPQTTSASQANWSNDDKQLLVTSGRKAFVWELPRAAEISKVEAPYDIHLASWYGGEEGFVALSDGGAEVSVWKPGTSTPITTIRADGGHVVSAKWAPEGYFSRDGPIFHRGPRLAVADSAGHTIIWYADRQSPVQQARLAVQGEGVVALDWHPDGDRLVTANGKGVVAVWDAGDAKEDLCSGPSGRGMAGWAGVLGWSADSNLLLFSQDKTTLRIWNLLTNKRMFRFLPGNQVIAGGWSPDGSRIAAVGTGLLIWEATADKDQPILSRKPQIDQLFAMAWSPDSRRIAIGGRDTIVRIMDAVTGEEDVFARGHRGTITTLAWSPDGRQIASASLDWTVRVWNSYSHNPRSTLTLIGHQGAVLGVTWSPDGSRIATVDTVGVLKLWDARSGRELASVKNRNGGFLQVTYSPNGQLLAAVGNDGSLKIWDNEARERLQLTVSMSPPVAVSWSRDGGRLAVGYDVPDNNVRVYEIDHNRLLALARRRLVAIVPAK